MEIIFLEIFYFSNNLFIFDCSLTDVNQYLISLIVDKTWNNDLLFQKLAKFSKEFGGIQVDYFQRGSNPKLIVLTGTHGNENDVIASTGRAILKHIDELPDFVCIPEVSPSSVSMNSRVNANGVDLNRTFFDRATEPETVVNMMILQPLKCEVMLTVHEDPDSNDFYMYDSGDMTEDTRWTNLKIEVRGLGVNLLNGLDDSSDPALGLTMVNGYKPHTLLSSNPVGMIETWCLQKGIIERVINPEIPGGLSQRAKDKIVDAVFRNFLIVPSR